MRKTIKRNSKKFLILFFCAIFTIIGGIVISVTTPIASLVNGLYLILAGFGLLLLTLSISTTDKKSSEALSICSGLFYGVALLCGSLISFKSDHVIMPKIVALCGIFVICLTLYSIVLIFKRRSST